LRSSLHFLYNIRQKFCPEGIERVIQTAWIREVHDMSFIELASNFKTVVKVADNGVGMPEEVIEKIFIPFFSTKKSGSGIGLSLCKQIMMLHRGNIQLQSVEGEGTAFTHLFCFDFIVALTPDSRLPTPDSHFAC
jgi:signal transduction histidine kinase